MVWFRVVILVLLLAATGWPSPDLMRGLARLDMDIYWPAWPQFVGIALVFVGVMLIGRRRRQPLWLLAMEALVAAVLAFVPPPWWVMRLGVGGFLTDAVMAGFLQPLAMACASLSTRSARTGC